MHGLDGEALPSRGLSKVYFRADLAHCILYYTTPNEYHALVPLIRIGPVHSILWVLTGCICPHGACNAFLYTWYQTGWASTIGQPLLMVEGAKYMFKRQVPCVHLSTWHYSIHIVNLHKELSNNVNTLHFNVRNPVFYCIASFKILKASQLKSPSSLVRNLFWWFALWRMSLCQNSTKLLGVCLYINLPVVFNGNQQNCECSCGL